MSWKNNVPNNTVLYNMIKIIGSLRLDGAVGNPNYGTSTDYSFFNKIKEITKSLSLHEWSPPIGTKNLNVFSNLQFVNSIRINHIHDTGTIYTSLSGLEKITSVEKDVFVYNGKCLTLQLASVTMEIRFISFAVFIFVFHSSNSFNNGNLIMLACLCVCFIVKHFTLCLPT